MPQAGGQYVAVAFGLFPIHSFPESRADLTESPSGTVPESFMGAIALSGSCGTVGNDVVVTTGETCNLWNFPSG